MASLQEDVAWFKENATGVETMKDIDAVVLALKTVAGLNNFDFRKAVAAATTWALTHPKKKKYDRFYANWFRNVGRFEPRPVISQARTFWEEG